MYRRLGCDASGHGALGRVIGIELDAESRTIRQGVATVVDPPAAREEVPEEGVALWLEALDVGTVRNAGEEVRRDLPAVLRRIAAVWLDAYHELGGVDARHREEISFGLAALRANVELKPAPLSLQGNWEVASEHSALFHYGGSTEQAERSRLVLESLAPLARSAEATELEARIRRTIRALRAEPEGLSRG